VVSLVHYRFEYGNFILPDRSPVLAETRASLQLSANRWLQVSQRVLFKTATVAFDCIRVQGPGYFSDVYLPVTPLRLALDYDPQVTVTWSFCTHALCVIISTASVHQHHLCETIFRLNWNWLKPLYRIKPNFLLMDGIHDIITCVRFGDDRLRSSKLFAGSKFSISHWLCWSSLHNQGQRSILKSGCKYIVNDHSFN